MDDFLNKGEKIIAKETDYSSGSIGWFGWGVNDAYDIYLVENAFGNYILIIFMKIQFFFEDSKSLQWTTFEKETFVARFKLSINKAWGNLRFIKKLPSGKNIFLDFRFNTWIEGWSTSEHWEVYVKKVKKFSRSSVNPLLGNVYLDSKDFDFTNKTNGMQRGVVHEFGHMLGLPDEYEIGTKYEKDYQSIMNSGETIKSRHDAVYVKWLEKVLKEKNIN